MGEDEKSWEEIEELVHFTKIRDAKQTQLSVVVVCILCCCLMTSRVGLRK